MTINNYSVAMNAQYYNLSFESTETSISSRDKSFSNDKSDNIKQVALDPQKSVDNFNKLSGTLASSIIDKLHSESQRLVGDKVEISTTVVEAESLSYQVDALIQADGKEIELSLDVFLSRSFIQQTSLTTVSLTQLQDPLVINLNGSMPSLSSKTFSFDIDSDGTSNQISMLSQGNVYLALDKNENGMVDDGSELFGTKSGDGFADLRKYDEDNNGWIDENDAIFDKLQIWSKTDTENKLIGLGEVGIGAIFLGSTQTQFSLKSETNDLLGEIKKSGFFLYESGLAGVISQVDLVVDSDTKKKLDIFDEMKKSLEISKNKNLYLNSNNNTATTNEVEDIRLEKLQERIKALETKLRNSKEEDKANLQAQIGVLYSQMMTMLNTGVS